MHAKNYLKHYLKIYCAIKYSPCIWQNAVSSISTSVKNLSVHKGLQLPKEADGIAKNNAVEYSACI